MAIESGLSEAFKSARQTMKQTGAKSVTINYGSTKKDEKKKAEPAKSASTKPAAKAPAKKQSAGGIVDAKAKGSSIKPKAGEMAKKVDVKKADKKEMSAKQEAKVSRLAQKKEKLKTKGEQAIKAGDQTRAKRLRERYDRKTERIKKVSK